jgi:hypothetical protein
MALLKTLGERAVWCILLLVSIKITYEFFFSPLRYFRGPFVAKFSNAWRAAAAALGHIDRTNINWHRKYGGAVRIGPNTISISDPSLIRTIYTTKNAWKKVGHAISVAQRCTADEGPLVV